MRANWSNHQIELTLGLETSANHTPSNSSQKFMKFTLNREMRGNLYFESHKEKIGRSNSYVEVILIHVKLSFLLSFVLGHFQDGDDAGQGLEIRI